MGDALRRAIEIADLKSNTPDTTTLEDRIEAFGNDLTIEEVFDPTIASKRMALKGAANWVAQKERPFVYGDRKHQSGHGDEHRDAIVDNQRFDVGAAVTKRLKEKAEAEAAAANVPRIATGLSDPKQEVVSEQTSEGPSDLLREDGPNVGTYVDQQTDETSAVDRN